MGERPDDPPSTGPPDRQTLELLERRLASDPLIVRTTFEPSRTEPRVLEAAIDRDRYPSSVDRGRLDVRWFTSGDFTVHYVERWESGDRWECRWDRHPNSHNSRLHFHEPPDCTEIVDLEVPTEHPIDVLSTVLAAVEARIERGWQER